MTFIEYSDMIRNHNESQLDFDYIYDILIGFEYQLDDDSTIPMEFE